ncbi:MAG: aldo/keto reductase [Spirochaetes bacterium]|uniref:Aldo/keto reductase n=1 Tax=Candidatus Ornithospirochaeta stercoripullorum TaxID=2840899 RepID=A0A9D9E206_9SPIO|nr:aldo/keto reductase [Candidatus Ornithospirochaeta stercoripullorum]
MEYRKAGKSGLFLPELSLGMWQNFGKDADDIECRNIIKTAFDNGITYFDLADNYGPPAWSAEERFGKIARDLLTRHRDEIVIATKAGYDCWDGPYGNWGSKKHLIASLDKSLKLFGIEYVDIFYHHRPDPETPMEETAEALETIVRSGKALYIAISNYNFDEARKMAMIMKRKGFHILVDQVRYNIIDRHIERDNLLKGLGELGIGCVAFSPLNQGILTEKYISGNIPHDSRGMRSDRVRKELTSGLINGLTKLDGLAKGRGQTISELAIAWLLSHGEVTSVLIGARTEAQLMSNIIALGKSREFLESELNFIDECFNRK